MTVLEQFEKYTVPEFLEAALKEFEEKFAQKKLPHNAKIGDFTIIKNLGEGAFGLVKLVQHKPSKVWYAMKCQFKIKIVKNDQVEHTKNEKKVLQCIGHPMIVRLEYFFMDPKCLYIVMDFIPGGEMFKHLSNAGKFPEPQARFYAGQVVLGFEYLHRLGLVYRDLKPENLLFNVDGYVKITDFGFGKRIKGGRTYSMCGTPEYLAPEVVESKGYGLSVDNWATGILIFEMVTGRSPFYDDDPMKIYEKICAGKFKAPKHMSKECDDLCHNILQVDLSKRFGNLKHGAEDIKKHKWFKGQDWDDLFHKKISAPFKPTCKDPKDFAKDKDDYVSAIEKEVAEMGKEDVEKYFKDF